jgi:hypothetical protein
MEQFIISLEKDPPIEILVENVQTQKMIQGTWFTHTTPVVKEMPLTIFLNDKEIVTFLCTGSHLEALAIGFLKSEGLIETKEMIALTHSSNVLGTILPIAETGTIARDQGIVFLVDGAQTLGKRLLNVEAMKIDLLACPGHKGLFGPKGTGFLFI